MTGKIAPNFITKNIWIPILALLKLVLILTYRIIDKQNIQTKNEYIYNQLQTLPHQLSSFLTFSTSRAAQIPIYLLIILCIIHKPSSSKSLSTLNLFALTYTLSEVLKMISQTPNSSSKDSKCVAYFGDPSTQAIHTSTFYGILFHDFLIRRGTSWKCLFYNAGVSGVYWVSMILPAVGSIYKGKNNANQAILGLFVGQNLMLWWLYFRPSFTPIFQKCLQKGKIKLSNNLKIFSLGIGIFVFSFLFWVYYVTKDLKKVYVLETVNAKCSGKFRKNNDIFLKLIPGILVMLLSPLIHFLLINFDLQGGICGSRLRRHFCNQNYRIFIIGVLVAIYTASEITETKIKIKVWHSVGITVLKFVFIPSVGFLVIALIESQYRQLEEEEEQLLDISIDKSHISNDDENYKMDLFA